MPDRYVIGVEAAYQSVQAGLIKLGDEPTIAHKVLNTEPARVNNAAPVDLIRRIRGTLQDLLSEAEAQGTATETDIDAIGISVPGAVDETHQILVESHHLNINNLALAASISQSFHGLKVRLANDGLARVTGEHRYGAGKSKQHVIYILVGWGVGSAMILNEQPYLGAGNMAGEFGHVKIAPDGAICSCGSVGCVEATASRDAVANRLWARVKGGWEARLDLPEKPEQITTAFLRDALDRQEKLVISLIDEAAIALGRALASVINLLTPSVIILGGEFIDGIDRLREQAITSARQYAIPLNAEAVSFARAALDPNGEIIGAAYLANADGY